MDSRIDQYFLHILNTKQKQHYQECVDNDNPILRLQSEDFFKMFHPLEKEHARLLAKITKKRVVFENEVTTLSASDHGSFVSVCGDIGILYQIEPYPYEIELQCKECKKNWREVIDVSILNPNPNNISCKNIHCPCYVKNKPSNEFKIQYTDVLKFTFRHDEKELQCFVENNPPLGFEIIVTKLKDAFTYNTPIIIHGYYSIRRIKGKPRYFLQVYDVDLQEKKTQKKIIPFVSIHQPTSEKEMVMGSFFANLEYMKEYFNFDSYQLQEKYPDLILYTQGKRTIVEFEYDVANFYYHKHHEQEPKCDLIIAWKCSTKKNEYPYVLIQDLEGSYITQQKNVFFDPSSMLQKLIDVLIFLYPSVDPQFISLLLFPILDCDIPVKILSDPIVEIHYDPTIDLSKIEFLVGESYFICHGDNGLHLRIELQDETEKDGKAMENIFEIKEYLEYIRRIRYNPPIRYEKEIMKELFSAYQSVTKVDRILVLLNLFAHFFRITCIGKDFVEYFFQIFPTLR